MEQNFKLVLYKLYKIDDKSSFLIQHMNKKALEMFFYFRFIYCLISLAHICDATWRVIIVSVMGLLGVD
jgi:hypothetical protein